MRWHKKDRNGYEKHAGLWLWIVWITLERELWNPHIDLGGQYAAWSVLLHPPTSLKKHTSVRLHTLTHKHTHTHTHTYSVLLCLVLFMNHNTAELMEPGLLWEDTLELCGGINLRLETSQFSKINSNKTWREKKKKRAKQLSARAGGKNNLSYPGNLGCCVSCQCSSSTADVALSCPSTSLIYETARKPS